ncbi:MAG TPA: DUF1223 domain-containing protein [Pyrinomonadaceae bacterium]|jgi:hypothetical protein
MKPAIIFLFLIFSTACTAQSQKVSENPASEIRNPKSKSPVLIELFTSEGCSSCPPADRVLALLEKEQPYEQAEIITLALHVDYWNYLGWKDEFSSALFSQRQELYAQKFKLDSTYTPQMVVDGEKEFNGSDSGKALKAVMEAVKNQKTNIEISRDGEKLKIKIAELPAREDATVYLAIAEDNLASDVKRGENSGQKLEHVSVARELKSIGVIDAKAKMFEAETNLSIQPNWKTENLKIIVFVQENASRKIRAVNRIKY